MGFPRYYQKNLQSAALLLQRIDALGFQARLQDEVIAIAADGVALRSKEGRAILDLTTRLLARLYPCVAFIALDASARKIESYGSLALSVNSNIDIVTDTKKVTQYIVLGVTRPRRRERSTVFVGSDNWLARISMNRPMACSESSNPFGAGAAACLAVANVFRRSFKTELSGARPDEGLTFSTIDLAPVDQTKWRNPLLRRFGLGAIHLAGAGAIGNGFLWAMARLNATGTVHVVDEERLASSNLQRYVMTTESDVDKAKVDLAKSWFDESVLELEPHPMNWEAFIGQAADVNVDRVAVAVDSAKARINIQASLPRITFNSWTQTGEVGLSRHGFNDGRACLACLYIPDRKAPNYDELIARALHLGQSREQLLDIRRRLQLSIPTDEAFVHKVAAASGVPADELMAFKDKPLSQLYTEGICGGAVVSLAKGGNTTQNEVPMAFQSALAGVLMAADLVCEHVGIRPRLPTKTQINLLNAVPPIPSNAQPKSSRCFCNDPEFTQAFAKRYPEQRAESVMTGKPRRRAITA